VENIKEEFGVPEAVEEPRLNTLAPCPDASFTDQA